MNVQDLIKSVESVNKKYFSGFYQKTINYLRSNYKDIPVIYEIPVLDKYIVAAAKIFLFDNIIDYGQ